jgi:DNA-binding protein H-NS
LSPDFEDKSIDELWVLRDEIAKVLRAKIIGEKRELERRLALLKGHPSKNVESRAQRRPYPKVSPKYRNPAKPSETWSGRGKQPKWVIAQLQAGKTLDDLAV